MMKVGRFVRTAYSWLARSESVASKDDVVLPTGRVPAPVCFLMDHGTQGRDVLVGALKSHKIDVAVFSDPEEMERAYGERRPQLVVLGSSLDMVQLEGILNLLSDKAFSGSVQPIVSSRNREAIAAMASKNPEIRILPGISDPVQASAIDRVVRAEGLARTRDGLPNVDLDIALKNGWIEFWYQPRVDLQTRMLSGVECVARLRHPVHGVLKRNSFLENASESAKSIMSVNSIRTMMSDWKLFRQFGHNVFINTYVPGPVWKNGRIFDALKRTRPQDFDWPGVGFDLDKIAEADAIEIGKNARRLIDVHKVRITINDFDTGVPSQLMASLLPVSKIKLPREVVQMCSSDPVKQKTCRELIAYAHGKGMRAVATGVLAKEDLKFLATAGCDAAQGRVFSRAVLRDQCMLLLQQHARVSAGSRA